MVRPEAQSRPGVEGVEKIDGLGVLLGEVFVVVEDVAGAGARGDCFESLFGLPEVLQERIPRTAGVLNPYLGSGEGCFGICELLLRWPTAEKPMLGEVGRRDRDRRLSGGEIAACLLAGLGVWRERSPSDGEGAVRVGEFGRLARLTGIDGVESGLDPGELGNHPLLERCKPVGDRAAWLYHWGRRRGGGLGGELSTLDHGGNVSPVAADDAFQDAAGGVDGGLAGDHVRHVGFASAGHGDVQASAGCGRGDEGEAGALGVGLVAVLGCGVAEIGRAHV